MVDIFWLNQTEGIVEEKCVFLKEVQLIAKRAHETVDVQKKRRKGKQILKQLELFQQRKHKIYELVDKLIQGKGKGCPDLDFLKPEDLNLDFKHKGGLEGMIFSILKNLEGSSRSSP